jgi:hypothetical protein
VFKVIEPCNLICGCQGCGGTNCFHLQKACKDRLACSSKAFNKQVQDYMVLTQNILLTLTTLSTSNLIPKTINKNWHVVGDFTFRILNYKNCSMFCTDIAYNTTIFFNHLRVTHGFISCFLRSEKTWDLQDLLVTGTFSIINYCKV